MAQSKSKSKSKSELELKTLSATALKTLQHMTRGYTLTSYVFRGAGPSTSAQDNSAKGSVAGSLDGKASNHANGSTERQANASASKNSGAWNLVEREPGTAMRAAATGASPANYVFGVQPSVVRSLVEGDYIVEKCRRDYKGQSGAPWIGIHYTLTDAGRVVAGL